MLSVSRETPLEDTGVQDTFDPFGDWAALLPPELVVLQGGGEGGGSTARPPLRLIVGERT